MKRIGSRLPRALARCGFVAGLLLWAACDGAEVCEQGPAGARGQVGIVANTRGEVLRTFPLVDEAAPASYRAEYARLERFAGHLLLAGPPNKIFDLDTGRLLRQLPTEWDVATSPRTGRLYFATEETGTYAFGSRIDLHQKLLASSLKAVQILLDGDTTVTTLFSASIQRKDSSRFETTRFLKPLPYGEEGLLLYFQETEVVTVTTDSLETQVFQDRFFFERSLWRYDGTTGTRERLVVLPTPRRETQIDHADVSQDGAHLVYEDNERVVYVDVAGGEVQPFEDRLRTPIVSEDGRRVLSLKSSCGQTYQVDDLASKEDWVVLATSYCGANSAAFSEDGGFIYFGDTERDTVGLWKVDVTYRLWGDDGTPPQLVFAANDVIPVKENHHLASLSQPLFLSPTEFVVLHSYEGWIDVCR